MGWKNPCSASLVQGSELKQASSVTSQLFASVPEESREVFVACPEQAQGDTGVVSREAQIVARVKRFYLFIQSL